MKPNMLYVALDKDLPASLLAQKMNSLGIEEWVYLGQDNDWIRRTESELASSIHRVSTIESLDRISWHLRQPYIEWIGQLSQHNQSVEWWGSAFCAKNPYSRMYLRVCLLELAKQLIGGGIKRRTLLVFSSPALRDGVISLASEASFSVEVLSGRGSTGKWSTVPSALQDTFSALYRPSIRVLRASRTLVSPPGDTPRPLRRNVLAKHRVRLPTRFIGDQTILFFTWIDKRSFRQDGRYQDPYFGPLPELLKERGYRVAFVARVLPSVSFEDAVARLARCGEEVVFPELLLSEQNWTECTRRAEEFSPVMPMNGAFEGLPIHQLVQEHVAETTGALADALSYQFLAANAAAAGIHPRRVIFTCEGHGWEQVMTWSVRCYMPDTKVVGYDNVTFSRQVLSMFPAQGEYGLRPLPDTIVTNGPFYRDLLIKEGMPSGMVISGCALRHDHLWKGPLGNGAKRTVATVKSTPSQVLVATSVSPSDSVELVAYAVRALGGDPRYELIIKCHPVVDVEVIRSKLGALLQQGNVHFTDSPAQSILPSVDVLLYTYTVLCYEALAYGVPPVCVRTENSLDLDKLEAVPEVRWVARTPEELRRVVAEVLAMPAEVKQRWQERASQVVGSALSPVTPEAVNAFLGEAA